MTNTTNRLIVLGSAILALLAACAPVGNPGDGPSLSTAGAVGTAQENLPPPPVAIPDSLGQRIEAAIRAAEQREVLISNGFWTVGHGILGVGTELTLLDPATGNRVNAIDFICKGGPIRGMRFIPTPHGLDVQNGPIFVGQGHVDQFVAEMVQIGLPLDREFIVDGTSYTFMDFVRQSQARVRVTSVEEASWSLVVLADCLGTGISWTNSFGETLSFEDLVRYELDQDVENAACGGAHRLFGLCWARQTHIRRGGQDVGVWREVAEKMKHYQQRARELQNPDGSLSTESFRGPGNSSDMKQRISTTGHVLEWLALSMTDEELREPWVQKAANALALMILEIQNSPMEGGTLYHAVHALRMYAARHAVDHVRCHDRNSPVPRAPMT